MWTQDMRNGCLQTCQTIEYAKMALAPKSYAISNKNYGKNCYFNKFLFLPTSLTLRKNEQNLCQAMLWVHNTVHGEWRDFKN